MFLRFLVDFVLGPKNESLLQCYDKWRGWADPKVCCDYSFHVAVTWWNEQVSKEMDVLVKEKGTYSLTVLPGSYLSSIYVCACVCLTK